MSAHLQEVIGKMARAGAHAVEVRAMEQRLRQLANNGAGEMLHGSDLESIADLAMLDDLPLPSPVERAALFSQLVVIKLNGGLGTSMGLTGAKSLLKAKGDLTFLDVIATQVLSMREADSGLPLVLMNSPGTRDDSLKALQRYADLQVKGISLDFLQGVEPKLRADDLRPVEWPTAPELEWCPPGHGDLYTAIVASGLRDKLLDAGIRWCFASNADNLGAVPDDRILKWMSDRSIPFLLEAVRGTLADRKGGHLASKDGRIVLRESAQVPEGDTSFGDLDRWRYFNTNNVWFDLEFLRTLQDNDPAAPHLPLIVNRKTVDPRDSASTAVLQLEGAMGAAIGSIDGAQAIEVARARFAPVKTTDDLLVARSDAFELRDDGHMVPRFAGQPPVVTLDRSFYGRIDDFEKRFQGGPPSLRRCTSLRVRGDVRFGSGVVVEGDVELQGPMTVPDGSTLR
jgi:UTP--glucose-1-phosphate uridylyltransferase